MGPARVHVRIFGRVQGVFFRAATVAEAELLQLKGWVRNCPDGSVEVTAEGARAKLEKLIAWCHHGPEGAVVRQVVVDWQGFTGEFQDFRIAR